MKITGNQGISVNLSSLKESGSLLKNMNPGDSVSASVIRSDGNKALLNISGRIVRAEFTGGVPAENKIVLILTSKTPESIQFSLKENDAAEKIFRIFSPFSILNDDETKKVSLQNLGRFIALSKPDMMDINLFLLGFKKDEQKGKSSSTLFNHLLQKGVPLQTLIDISYIIYSKYNPVLFMSFQSMLAMAGKKAMDSFKKDPSLFEDFIDHFCNILKEDNSDFSLMFDLFSDENMNREIYGELVFPENEKFSGIEYVLNVNSVFFKLNLSETGILEVFIRSENDRILINFLSGRENVILYLKENESVLKEMLARNGVKKSNIGYFDSQKIVDKITLWSLDFYTKSKFNIKA